ncbi:MAG: ATP synthase F1 subunit gamma [Flavobacteriaceae bacterium]|jgi:F-type H+-transporting ATPase subunit gamma|nr:ATP synthase F1 subunit gamma [Flavobacteriaceae bacterium]
MATLKEIRNRITSVNSTRQITSAMMMVASAKLKKAQNAIQRLLPYSQKMQELLSNLSSSMDSEVGGEFVRKGEVEKVLLVVISSNRGLAGAFNSSVVKAVKSLLEDKYKDKQVDILPIGKKAYAVLDKIVPVYKNHSNLWNAPTYENTAKIADEVIEKFTSGDYDKVELVYNHFKNVIVQVLQVEPFLPIELNPEKKSLTSGVQTDYIFEPTKEQILKNLIPKTLRTQFFKAILDSHAAEHGARMSAMQSATDNAKTLTQELTISYNKARQAAITGELIEIVSGAQALEG